ncbi:MAG: Outer membrane lipoprotein Omp16 [Chlamydiae bacterium]|nr:Outer membrane lipoprotein Omp16 [Chlamydiota bacterium]
MNRVKLTSIIYLSFMALLLVGCCRSADDTWDDTKTCGRHMGRGFRSLGGKHGDSRQVCCREDFLQCKDDEYCMQDFQAMEFEPLSDQNYSKEIAMVGTRKKATTSYVPRADEFQDPRDNPALSSIFQNVHFPYNSSLVKSKEGRDTVRAIAEYMKKHPGTYVYVEGHCDERGAEAYNLALGTRRCNAVRSQLIKEGVDPEHIMTVSYGKERPLDLGQTEEVWARNRRAEFKVYQQ